MDECNFRIGGRTMLHDMPRDLQDRLFYMPFFVAQLTIARVLENCQICCVSVEQMKVLGGSISEGDVLLSNHPCAGGSHLPDLTVITPVQPSVYSLLCFTSFVIAQRVTAMA